MTNDKLLLEPLLRELARSVAEGEEATKAQALARRIVDEAVTGDAKMLASLVKLLEKAAPRAEEHGILRHSRADWEALFTFYGKYRALIEQEIARLQKANPAYWDFGWFTPHTAPWRAAMDSPAQ